MSDVVSYFRVYVSVLCRCPTLWGGGGSGARREVGYGGTCGSDCSLGISEDDAEKGVWVGGGYCRGDD